MTEYKDKWCQEAYNKGFKEGRDFEKGQLTKAKEIIKKLCTKQDDYCMDCTCYKFLENMRAEAKQFLNENCTYERIQKAKYNYTN